MTDNSPSINVEDAERFAKLFRGYDKAHGKFEIPKSAKGTQEKVKGNATTVPADVTPQLFLDHLEGRLGLGILPLDGDERVSWACIDIDVIGIDCPSSGFLGQSAV